MISNWKEKIKGIIKKPEFWLILIIILGVGIRLYNLPKPPFGQDLKFFQDWTQISLQNGIPNIYNFVDGKLPVDYPPVYLYVLTVLGLISRDIFNINPDSAQFEYFIKFLNIFIDLACAGLIYLIVKKLSSKVNAVLSLMAYFLNPYVIYTGAVWGQVDNLISLFTLSAIYLYITKHKNLSFASIAVGLLTKLQIVIVSPLLFLHFLFNNTFRSLIKSMIIAIFAIVLIIFPFILSNNVTQVVYTYTNSTGRYPHISMNAYNFWWLFANPKEIFAVSSDTPLKDLVIAPTYKDSNFDKGDILSSKNLAYFMFFIIYILLCLNVFIKKDFENLFLSMAIASLAFFTLNVQIHERYLYPFFALFSLIFMMKPKYIVTFILLSILGWINLMFVFTPNGIISELRSQTFSALTYVISICNVLVLLVLLFDVLKNFRDEFVNTKVRGV